MKQKLGGRIQTRDIASNILELEGILEIIK